MTETLRLARREWHEIEWPTRSEWLRLTGISLAVIVGSTALIAVVDLLGSVGAALVVG